MNDIAGYSRFEEVQDGQLRAYNRLVTANNILNMHGKNLFKTYVDSFNELERLQMVMVASAIKAKGQHEVTRELTNKMGVVNG